MERIEHWPDLGYTCVATADADPALVSWKVYVLYAYVADGESRRGWQRSESAFSPDIIDSLDGAEVFAEGSTRFDGCSNWSFNDDSSGYALHTCDRDAMLNIGQLLARVHDLCGHMMKWRCIYDPAELPVD